MNFPIPKLPNGIPQVSLQLLVDDGGYDEETGGWVDSLQEPIDFKGAVLPIQDKLAYSGGTYSREDRKVYTDDSRLDGVVITENMLVLNTVDGSIYTIDAKNPYGDISSRFKRLFLKRREDTNR